MSSLSNLSHPYYFASHRHSLKMNRRSKKRADEEEVADQPAPSTSSKSSRKSMGIAMQAKSPAPEEKEDPKKKRISLSINQDDADRKAIEKAKEAKLAREKKALTSPDKSRPEEKPEALFKPTPKRGRLYSEMIPAESKPLSVSDSSPAPKSSKKSKVALSPAAEEEEKAVIQTKEGASQSKKDQSKKRPSSSQEDKDTEKVSAPTPKKVKTKAQELEPAAPSAPAAPTPAPKTPSTKTKRVAIKSEEVEPKEEVQPVPVASVSKRGRGRKSIAPVEVPDAVQESGRGRSVSLVPKPMSPLPAATIPTTHSEEETKEVIEIKEDKAELSQILVWLSRGSAVCAVATMSVFVDVRVGLLAVLMALIVAVLRRCFRSAE